MPASVESHASSIHIPLPPTTHALDAAQRTRVIRSARKLGAVLGTTPFYMEPNGDIVPVDTLPASAVHSRSHSHPLPRPSSPIGSLRRWASVLDIHSTRITTQLPRSASIDSSPSSSTVSLPTTPDEALPLLFSPSPRKVPRGAAGAPRPPILRLNSFPPSPSDLLRDRSPPTPTSPILGDARRRKMERVMRTLGEPVPQELVFARTPSPTPCPIVTVSTNGAREELPVLASKAQKLRHRNMFVHGATCLPPPVYASSVRAPQGERWVGEWNRHDIGEVQRELRQMRCR
ncbi:hypothetical protein BV25DRAFT_590168 [Artomyces pyxidatus]|uniref:Uncharacterized protein n=1 Tax=Artomyces pyxidatus TaxID=48021 RepID=A0ACB8T3D3_9AGAM|nr:hypothetical protein BV25DRAFT_590168 [Artomyces pyxidatus]